MNLYILKINFEESKKNIKKLFDKVSKNRRKKASIYIGIEDQIRSLYSEIFLRKILKEYDILDFEIEENEYSKPYLKEQNIFFNISHSGEYLICGVSEREVGVDIEKIGELASLEIADMFFYEEEKRYLEKSKHKISDFYKIWTLKESYIKFLGKGLSKDLKEFYFKLDNQKIKLIDNKKEIDINIFSNKIEGYFLAISFLGEDKVDIVEYMSEDIL